MNNTNNIPIQGSPDASSIDRAGDHTPVDYNLKIFRSKGPIPVFSKNHSKQNDQNRAILERNIPIKPKTLQVGHRGKYKVCQKYKDLNDQVKQNGSDKVTPVDPLQNNINEFNPGIGKYTEFLNKIDIDSHLRQGYKHSECEENLHKQIYCSTKTVDDPRLLDNPTCQNYKIYQFDDPNKINAIPSNTANIDAQSDSLYRSDIEDSSLVYFNYTNNNSTCMGQLPSKKTLSNLKQPLLFQQHAAFSQPLIRYPLPLCHTTCLISW